MSHPDAHPDNNNNKSNYNNNNVNASEHSMSNLCITNNQDENKKHAEVKL